jgi:APA family basic amino acid/polyamine antiporter
LLFVCVFACLLALFVRQNSQPPPNNNQPTNHDQVSLGAVSATFNTVLTILYSLQRMTVVLARTHLLPSFLGRIWQRRQTPAPAGLATGAVVMLLAFCVPLDVLVGAVSMGTLVAFSCVCFGVAWRQRYTGRGCGTPMWKLLPSAFLVFAAPLALGLTLTYAPDEAAAWPAYLACALLWAGATASFHAFPVRYNATAFSVPLKPWLPCLGVGGSMFLAGNAHQRCRFFSRTAVFFCLFVVSMPRGTHAPSEDTTNPLS